MVSVVSFDLNTIVDAIAVDLAPIAKAATPGPKGYTDWRYLEPELLTLDSAPWLAIYSPTSSYQLIATFDDYQDDDQIVIEWAVPIGQTAEDGGAGAPAVAKAAIDQAAPLLAQLRTYAQGLPTPFTDQVVGTLSRSQRMSDRALVFAQQWTLVVTSLGAE